MKKLMAVSAIVLVISAISFFGFAAAYGKGVVDGKYENYFNDIENKLEAIEERFDNSYHDFDFDDYDGTLKTKTTVEPEAYQAQSIVIGTDASQVVLMPSQDGYLSAEVMTYSRTDSDSLQSASVLREYSENGVDYNLYVKAPDTNASFEIKAIVYIPDTVKDVIFVSSVGELEADGGIVLDSLNANIGTGSADIERANIDKCNISVDTGKIDIESGFSAGTSVTAHVGTGKIDCTLPLAAGYTVNYSAQTCKLDDDMPINIKLFDSDGNPTNTVKPSGKIESSDTSEKTVEANLSVNTGKIEFDTD